MQSVQCNFVGWRVGDESFESLAFHPPRHFGFSQIQSLLCSIFDFGGSRWRHSFVLSASPRRRRSYMLCWCCVGLGRLGLWSAAAPSAAWHHWHLPGQLCHLCFGINLERSILLNTYCWCSGIWLPKGSALHTSLAHLAPCSLLPGTGTFKENDSGIGSGAMVPLRKLDCICSLAHHDAKLRKRNPDYPMLTEEDPLKNQDEMMSCVFMLFLWVETFLKLNPPSPDESNTVGEHECPRMDPNSVQMKDIEDTGTSLEGHWLLWLLCPAQFLQERKRNPPRRVPLSLQHPETGRRAIYGINSSTCFVMERGQEPRLIYVIHCYTLHCYTHLYSLSLLILSYLRCMHHHIFHLEFYPKRWWSFPWSQRFACGDPKVNLCKTQPNGRMVSSIRHYCRTVQKSVILLQITMIL